jgi:uncharacterized repeat protein (TIGR03803 family)
MIGHLFQTKLQLTAILLFLAICVTPISLHAQTFTDLHDFNCTTDGCPSSFPLTVAQGQDGNLYGTLPAGGSSNNGTVYRITPSGTLTVIYYFSGSDGVAPFSGLTLGTDGDLYGATSSGGANGYGTLFKITTAGALTTLHNFTAAEGGGAYGTPVQGKNGTFYGVLDNYSKAYSITSSGKFKLLPNPTPGPSRAPLLLANDGNLYGTTHTGPGAYGSVFRMSSTGAITLIFNFDSTHEHFPYGPVVQGSEGFLYGTVAHGGSGANSEGVVFKLSTKGAMTVLHEFDGTSTNDGFEPIGGLVAATDGNFYGTTSRGVFGGSAPRGTLFKITRTGNYTMLHAFDCTHSGDAETSPAQNTNGIVYGETDGGVGSGCQGDFYKLDAGLAPFVSLVGFPVGPAGQTVEILGKGLTGTTSVMFGSGSASYTVVSDTYMTAVVPTSGTTGTVTVATPGGTLKSVQPYKVVPVIKSFSPTNGPVGTQVTITGSGFTGANKVSFGGVNATVFSVNSAGTQITATVPSGAITGKIKVTTKGGTATSSGTFTVT